MLEPAVWGFTFTAGLLCGWLLAFFWQKKKRARPTSLALSLLEDLPLPLWQRDETLNLCWSNKAAQDLIDFRSKKDQPDDPALALAKRARRNNRLGIESCSLVVQGVSRVVDIYELPLPDAGTLGFSIDQTALEAAQAELVRHVSAHHEMLQYLHTAIFIFGRDKRLSFFNEAAADLFLLDPSHLDDAPSMEEWLELLRDRRKLPEYADFRSFSRDFVKRVMTLLGPTEELIHNPQGQTFRMLANPHPLGGTVLTFEDVTDRLALERKYNTLIKVQKETIDHLVEGVAVYGADGRLKLFNQAFVDIWHLDPASLASEPHLGKLVGFFAKLMPDHPELVERLTDDLMLRETRQWRLQLKDLRVVDIIGVPLIDGSRLYQYTDVTDSLQKARALEERNAALLAADRLKSEFMANVSYEFRTPLNAIVGYAELLKREYFGFLNERQKEYTAAILDSAHDLVELIGNVIDVAAIEAGYVRLEAKAVSLEQVLRDCVTLLKPRQVTKSVDLIAGDFSGLGNIKGDGQRLKQAFGSLLNVAFTTAPNGSKVLFSAKRALDYVDVTVAQGYEEDLVPQGANFNDRGRDPVSGLSLALTKTLVELHGGHLLTDTASSSWRVTCRLPL